LEKTNTILYVEDEYVIAEVGIRVIENLGYKTVGVNSGEEAIRCGISDESLSLILMDIDLGKGVDGIEAALQILEKRQIPIVFLSSHSREEYEEDISKFKYYGFLHKNLPGPMLHKAIENALISFESDKMNC